MKCVTTVMMKYVEFGLVLAGEERSTNPSLRRGTAEKVVKGQMPWALVDEGMLIHLNRSELTEQRIGTVTLSCEKNLTLDYKLTPLHRIRNSNRFLINAVTVLLQEPHFLHCFCLFIRH